MPPYAARKIRVMRHDHCYKSPLWHDRRYAGNWCGVPLPIMPQLHGCKRLLTGTSLLAMCVMVCPGCGRRTPAESRVEAREWFEWSTGLKLPQAVTVRDARCFTVFAIGDTFYIEMNTGAELEAMLKEQFTAISAAPEDLTPPADWLKEMPFWTVRTLASPQWFSRNIPASGESEWTCSVAYDAQAGKCFFMAAQCR